MKHLLLLVVSITVIGSVLLVSCVAPMPSPPAVPAEEAAGGEVSEEAAEEAEEGEEVEQIAEIGQADSEGLQFEPWMLNFFAPLPAEATPVEYVITDDLVNLGRMLYYENRLSINQQMSCNTCHLLDRYGVDGRDFSLGHEGKPVGRNSPTVYNAALHVAQFWDGRAATVEEQAKGPILAGGEMGMPNPEHVINVLISMPGYLPYFETAFPQDPDPINFDNVARAIGAFERRLLTPSRFDLFLTGDESQLTDQEQRGLATFVTTGCMTCHAGPAVGGEMFRKLGMVKPYETEDLGRYNVTGNEADKYVFKVPSLRNIAETGPYLHDGSVETLDEVVRIMGEYQLGRDLTEAQVGDIVAFLNSLTGEIPEDYIAVPVLPESGPDTPSPGETE